jgi:pimeloyl-ACP methyl ester carboxylesterase
VSVSRAIRTAVAAGASLVVAAPTARAGDEQPELSFDLQIDGDGPLGVAVRDASGHRTTVSWDSLDRTLREPGHYDIEATIVSDRAGGVLGVPWCLGTQGVWLDGRSLALRAGPRVVPIDAGPHALLLRVAVSAYESRIACSDAPRVGSPREDGLGLLRFPSPEGPLAGGQAVVFVPTRRDRRHPGPLLVGTHPWNGTMWTYAAYRELLRAAEDNDVVLLMPSGLGNSLYTAPAEAEVLRAIDALSTVVAIDPRAVSIWGASMGGAGAATIGFHHPDRFASVTSFFGDSKYDLSTYAGAILRDDRGAHVVNALDVADNARYLRVWLVHGEDDRTCPIVQSRMLDAALRRRGFDVRFDSVPGVGHSKALVARFLADVVSRAATARVPATVDRVTYRSTRTGDLGAYGVHIVRTNATADAFVDVQRREDGVHVVRAEGLRSIVFEPGALGTSRVVPPRIVVDGADDLVRVSWGQTP